MIYKQLTYYFTHLLSTVLSGTIYGRNGDQKNIRYKGNQWLDDRDGFLYYFNQTVYD